MNDDDIQEITHSSMPPPSSIGKGEGILGRGSLGQGKHTLVERKGKTPSRIGGYFMPRTTLRAQPTLKSVLQSKEAIERCDLALSKWMIDTCIAFNVVNSKYYQ